MKKRYEYHQSVLCESSRENPTWERRIAAAASLLQYKIMLPLPLLGKTPVENATSAKFDSS